MKKYLDYDPLWPLPVAVARGRRSPRRGRPSFSLWINTNSVEVALRRAGGRLDPDSDVLARVGKFGHHDEVAADGEKATESASARGPLEFRRLAARLPAPPPPERVCPSVGSCCTRGSAASSPLEPPVEMVVLSWHPSPSATRRGPALRSVAVSASRKPQPGLELTRLLRAHSMN